MNILLIYPEYPDTFWSFKHALRFVSKQAAQPPLGLLTVASLLPFDWKKRLVDVNVRELKDSDIKWADMVFVGAMIVQKESAHSIISRCKKMGKTIVAGGPAFTNEFLKFPEVDHFVLGEAEVTLPMFLDDISSGTAKKVYKSSIRPDIRNVPLPMWPLISFKDYSVMTVQYSRGCPFDCEFCDIVVMNGRIPRTKTSEQMIIEFQILYDLGWRGTVFIVDDNFIGNKVNVKRMLPAIIEWQKKHKYPFNIMTEASLNLADDTELMQLMSAANFYKVFLGIETPCIESLQECGKTQNVNTNLVDAVRKIHGHGIQVMGGFIVGFDSDKDSIFDTQIRFIQKIGVVTAMVGLLNVLPQTRLWHRLRAEGRLLGESTGENTDCSINFVPVMGKKKLIEGYQKIIRNIYSPKHYYKRINTFIKSYKPTVKSRLTKSDFLAFIRSIYRIGIFSKARFYYWHLIGKTLLTKRKAFPAAIELAIYRQHFEKVVKRNLAVS